MADHPPPVSATMNRRQALLTGAGLAGAGLAARYASTSRDPVPAYTHGAPENMTAYLDFGDRLAGGGEPLTDAEVFTTFARVAGYLYPSLGITVTTVPPVRRPGEYVTVRFLGSRTVPWRETATGQCPRKAIFNTSWYVPNVVYVALMPNAEIAAAVAAHEVVHCLQPDGVSHEEVPVGTSPNLMHPTAPIGGKLSANMTLLVGAQIAELDAGRRLGAFVKPSTGQWTFDWHNIGD